MGPVTSGRRKSKRDIAKIAAETPVSLSGLLFVVCCCLLLVVYAAPSHCTGMMGKAGGV